MLKMKIKYLLIIALIVLSNSLSKADDYYEIPPGWEKVIEFDSTKGVYLTAYKDQILVYERHINSRGYDTSFAFYSNDFGRKFENLNNLIKPDIQYYEHAKINYTMFINGKLSGISQRPTGWLLFKYDFNTGTADSFKIAPAFACSLGDVLFNNLDSTIIVKFYFQKTIVDGASNLCFISRDGGNTWEYLDLYRNPRNCNLYNILYDKTKFGRWVYTASDYDGIEPVMHFLTEDNGKTFEKLINPNLNIDALSIDNNDKNLSSYFHNSVYRYLIKNNSKSRSGLIINDIFYNQPQKTLDLKNDISYLFSNIKDSNTSINIYNDDIFEVKNVLFFTVDNFASSNKKNDTLYQKIFSNLNLTNEYFFHLFRKVYYPSSTRGIPTKLLFFDKENSCIYVEICDPRISETSAKKRIIIRRQIFINTGINEVDNTTQTINLENNTIKINQEFITPIIKIFDVIGRNIGNKISSLNPFTIELIENLPNGVYFLNIEDNLKHYNYKLILNK